MRTYEVDAAFGVRLLASHLRANSRREAEARVEGAFKYALQHLNDLDVIEHPTAGAFDYEEYGSGYVYGITVAVNECEGCDCTCHEED